MDNLTRLEELLSLRTAMQEAMQAYITACDDLTVNSQIDLTKLVGLCYDDSNFLERKLRKVLSCDNGILRCLYMKVYGSPNVVQAVLSLELRDTPPPGIITSAAEFSATRAEMLGSDLFMEL